MSHRSTLGGGMYQFYERRPVGGRTQHEIDSTPRNRASRVCYPRVQQRREGGRQRTGFGARATTAAAAGWSVPRPTWVVRARGHAPSANKTIKVFSGERLDPRSSAKLVQVSKQNSRPLFEKVLGTLLRRVHAAVRPSDGVRASQKRSTTFCTLANGSRQIVLDARRRSARVECKTVL